MTHRRALVGTALLVMALVVPIRAASAAAKVPQVCELDAATVQAVLGVNSADKYAGPDVLTGGACSWRTTDPNCFLRVLSLRTHETIGQRRAVKKLLASTDSFDVAPKTLGTNAFFAHTDLGPGAAIEIERLYIPRGHAWVEIALSGRLGADGSHGLLVTAATAVPERLVV